MSLVLVSLRNDAAGGHLMHLSLSSGQFIAPLVLVRVLRPLVLAKRYVPPWSWNSTEIRNSDCAIVRWLPRQRGCADDPRHHLQSLEVREARSGARLRSPARRPRISLAPTHRAPVAILKRTLRDGRRRSSACRRSRHRSPAAAATPRSAAASRRARGGSGSS